MTIRSYASPEAFKQALEQRLRASARTGAAFARKRQLLVFDRFLARVVAVFGDAATLKGGLVLELRLERARTTKDIDLRMMGSPDHILAKLQEVARHNVGDFMTFEVGPMRTTPRSRMTACSTTAFGFAPSASSPASCTASRSASTWSLVIRSSANRTS